MNNPKNCRLGFTLVELLVVIAIIGVLVALLLPAVQAAREAARRNSCKNNLKQLALGAMNHESTTGHYPTGGWGSEWVGDADRGSGKDQPGGWIYNLLPFIEEGAKHSLPSDGNPNVHEAAQLQGALELLQQPVNVINCPSRRSGTFTAGVTAGASNCLPVDSGLLLGRSDYGANAGDVSGFDVRGPGSLQAALTGQQRGGGSIWETADTLGTELNFSGNPTGKVFSGLSFQRSEIAIRHISDGTSNTYFCGERNLNSDHYETGEHTADNETWCTGANNDNFRSANRLPRPDGQGLGSTGDESDRDGRDIFGSAHPSAWHAAYCDGSVRSLGYDIDLQVHRNNANRSDGRVSSE